MRTVPVEIGSRYTDVDWSQQLITVSEFISRFILVSGRLDQYCHLFYQILICCGK